MNLSDYTLQPISKEDLNFNFDDIYARMNFINNKIISEENAFFVKIASMCLGKPFDEKKDLDRFKIYNYSNKSILLFDGEEVGEIIRNYSIGGGIEFIPLN
ncbi:hypothetical protein [Pseudotenacibaculum haliotis]|uniref:Uncharacterized protein n=1 Tax=Pseudotenacibaculum haliotis TaxID=1862138 RepID=A0ABW5LRU8_9FLAO